MLIEDIDKKHKGLLVERFKKLQTNLSNYSFAELYLFRGQYETKLLFGKNLYIKERNLDGAITLMLTAPPNELDQDELLFLLKECDCIYPVPEKWGSLFDPLLFKSSHHEEDSDYIFTTERLAQYKGHEFSNQRNLERQFIHHYHADVFPLTEERALDAKKVLEKWRINKNFTPQEADIEPCQEALENLSFLGLEGLIYYVDKEPIGFLMGEPLNDEMFVLHFGKADIAYKGVFAYMYQTFAEATLHNYHCLNLEEDLGVLGLKRAKSEYHPDFYNVKLRVVHSPSM